MFKSTITCHVCSNSKVSFEPFSCLTVPMPGAETVDVEVTFVSANIDVRPDKVYRVKMTVDKTVRQKLYFIFADKVIVFFCLRIYFLALSPGQRLKGAHCPSSTPSTSRASSTWSSPRGTRPLR